MTLGIIGVGHMAGFLIAGFRRAGLAEDIILSPRNPRRAERLAGRFQCRVASDNQEVADAASRIFLCLRPPDAPQALAGLRLREDQLLISVVAGLAYATLKPLSSPARLVTAMPVSAAEFGESPTLLYPEDDEARRLLSLLGAVIPIAEESVFLAACANAAVYGWLFGLMVALEAENRTFGLSAAEARKVVTGTFRAAAGVALEKRDVALDEVLKSLATEDGITAEGLSHLERSEAIGNWRLAFAQIARRLSGRGEATRRSSIDPRNEES